MAASDTFAVFGLFLLLAFVVPGSVYTFFSYIYFPEFVDYFLEIDPTTAVGVVIVLGLLISSVCYTIEITALHPIYRKLKKDMLDLSILAKTEAEGKTNFYVNQVFGQYIMHWNIGMGLLLLTAVFLAVHGSEVTLFFNDLALPPDKLSSGHPDWAVFYKLSGGIILGIINIYLSVGPFRRTAVNAQAQYKGG